MSTNNDGGPAFPMAGYSGPTPEGGVLTQRPVYGMTLLDYFAGQALIGSVQRMAEIQGLGSETFPQNVAVHAYRIADAMLAERTKSREAS